MNGLAVLIPLALMMGLIGLIAFFWALRRGQFDDLDGAANRILIDDEDEPLPSAATAEAGNEGGKGQGAP